MRLLLIIPALLLAGCNNAGNWKNEQAELSNDLNGAAPAAENSAASSDTDYIDEDQPADDEANATATEENENAAAPVEDEAVEPDEPGE